MVCDYMGSFITAIKQNLLPSGWSIKSFASFEWQQRSNFFYSYEEMRKWRDWGSLLNSYLDENIQQKICISCSIRFLYKRLRQVPKKPKTKKVHISVQSSNCFVWTVATFANGTNIFRFPQSRHTRSMTNLHNWSKSHKPVRDTRMWNVVLTAP